ncbi:MAG: PAS domain S-box protein, partial [Deltaproteobacteria bacterium]|nr:PAS domain S-box protein [Deltaproteobacteria bacterium]
IELLPIANNQLLDSVYDQEQGSVSYFRIVQSWDKKPLMQLNITSTIPLISELQRTSLEQLLLMIGFVAATLILMSTLLIFWVNIPLKRITRGMDSGNPAIFKGLETSHSEFGNLAKLILRFFRQQAELASSEERFRSVVQTAGDAIITLRQDGSIAFWNRGAERVFGYDAREAVGRSAEMLLPSHRKDIYYDSLAKITADTPTASVRTPVEIVALKKNRQEFPAELSQAMWQSQDRTFYTIILRDITERKLAEEAQRKSEKRFRNIVENSLTGQCIVVDGHIRYKNQEQERLFGPLPDDHTFFDCDNVHPDDTKKVQSFYRDIISETVHT